MASAAAPRNPIPEAQAHKLMHAMADLHKGHLHNLLQMAKAVSGEEKSIALDISNVANDALAAVDPLLSQAIIYQRMQCESDRAELLVWLPDSMSHAREELNEEIDTTNQYTQGNQIQAPLDAQRLMHVRLSRGQSRI